jgi:FAD/FMN-containing dehydrogenase
MHTTDTSGVEELRERTGGRLAVPGDADWDTSRQAFNLLVDQRPFAVAFPAKESDAVEIVRFARERGLRVAPQRTGHNAEALGSLEGTILLNSSPMRAVEIDAEALRARVQAGAQWQDVVPEASELGLAAMHGSAPDIGIAGYSLGGGVGWYARKLGIAANSLTAIELVTADGRIRRVDNDHEPELFWALRGGGGNFGVATALEFELHPISEVYAGVLFFPYERSSEVLHAWHEWTATIPDELTSVGRMLQFPPIPEVPELLRGRSFAVVEAVFMGSEADGAELLEPLRARGAEMDTFATVPPVGIADLHMDPPMPVPYRGEDAMLGELPAKAIDDLIAAAGPGSESPLLSVELRHLGGALARPKPDHGALAAIEGTFMSYSVGMVVDQPSATAVQERLGVVTDALGPYAGGRPYLNFVERDVEASSFFDEDTFRRLQAVKAEVDPDGVFQANHEIEPAA